MKFIPLSLLVATMAVACTSCNLNGAHQAVLFNDEVVRVGQTLTATATVWADSLTVYRQTGTYSRLASQRVKMENYLDHHIDDLVKAKPVGIGGAQFKNEALNYLRLEKRMISDGFKEFEQLSENSSDDERNAVSRKASAFIKEEEQAILAFKAVQKKYAADNNFRLETKDLKEQNRSRDH